MSESGQKWISSYYYIAAKYSNISTRRGGPCSFSTWVSLGSHIISPPITHTINDKTIVVVCTTIAAATERTSERELENESVCGWHLGPVALPLRSDDIINDSLWESDIASGFFYYYYFFLILFLFFIFNFFCNLTHSLDIISFSCIV